MKIAKALDVSTDELELKDHQLEEVVKNAKQESESCE
jgi:hypothetical protein